MEKRGKHINFDYLVCILQFISDSNPWAFFTDTYRFAKRELHINSKTTLSQYLKSLIGWGLVEKVGRAYKIKDRGKRVLKELEEGKKEIRKEIEKNRPFEIRAYLVESGVPHDDFDRRITQFTEELIELGFGDYLPPTEYEFGHALDKAVRLVGPGPFKVHLIEKKVVGTTPPVVEVHMLSTGVLIFQIYLPDETPGLKEIFDTEKDLKATLRIWLDATERYFLIKLHDIFEGKIELRPIKIDKWLEPVKVIVRDRSKLGPTAPKSRL